MRIALETTARFSNGASVGFMKVIHTADDWADFCQSLRRLYGDARLDAGYGLQESDYPCLAIFRGVARSPAGQSPMRGPDHMDILVIPKVEEVEEVS